MLLWILAHNILYTYIAPFLERAGLGERVDLALLVFGASAIVGIWLTGVLVDRKLRPVTLLSLAGFALASLVLGVAGTSVPLVLLGIVAWGVTFGGAHAAPDRQRRRSMRRRPLLLLLAVAGGGVFGGLLLESAGAGSIPWLLLGLTLLATAVVALAHRHGFKPGPRVTDG